MSGYRYEILLGGKFLQPSAWQALFLRLGDFLGWHARWEIEVTLVGNTIHYTLNVRHELPTSLGLADFLFSPLDHPSTDLIPKRPQLRPCLMRSPNNVARLIQKVQRRGGDFQGIKCSFRSYYKKYVATSILIWRRQTKSYVSPIPNFFPDQILSLDFSAQHNFHYKKISKYLKSEKLEKLNHHSSNPPLLEANTFPYGSDKLNITIEDFDYAKHSLILGGSGSGKSRFLCSFIHRLQQTAPENYKVVVIDPHDALKFDLGEISDQCIIDFFDTERSIDLFEQGLENVNVCVELTLETFKTLLGASYNGRLERVLRHSIYLLLVDQNFTFSSLRQLLSDTEFRNLALSRTKAKLPFSVAHFFLTEFQELKSQAYNIAFAPIMAFIDEMQMTPLFNSETKLPSLEKIVSENFLSVFSLNRLRLGDKTTKVISGLLMQQVFLLAQNRNFSQHLIFVIDEVAVVENPILVRFLSEMRKFGVSLILAGQYFDQITPGLRSAILANAINYYIFRISCNDAGILAKNLQLKLSLESKLEDQEKLFTGLKTQECLVQVSRDGEIFTLFKAHVPDYRPQPNTAIPIDRVELADSTKDGSPLTFRFSLDMDIKVTDIMLENTTNRKKIT